jgi:signal transduction histidine kinase
MALESGEHSRITPQSSEPPPTSRSGPPSKTGPTPVQKSTVLDLRSVVVVTQVSFSLALATLLALAPPVLLLLNTELSASAARYAFVLTVLAGAIAALRSWLDMRRLDFLLRSLAEGGEIFDASDVDALSKQAGRSSVAWMWPHLLAYLGAAVLLSVTPLRPALMDVTTGISLMLLCAAIAATSTLALYATLRNSFLRVIELMPASVMAEVVLANENLPTTRGRITRRLLLAVLTPMLFVALGCALIANAHVRRADERSREEIARVMARAVFELGPDPANSVGLSDLYARAAELGFSTMVIEGAREYEVRRLEGGIVEVTTPLDRQSALVRFSGSEVRVLSAESILFAALAVIIAASLGLTLGNALTADLHHATLGVRLLGTRTLRSQAPGGDRPRARFKIVAELWQAIERLADRFRMFAHAQQDAIEARASATRMRGQFFASVSHDLKSPLNSILGFTELVRMEPLSEGQAESLQLIADRGQELLTLIETILDAARIEVGQLSLMFNEEPFDELYAATLEKAALLSGNSNMQIYEEIEHDLPPLMIDRMRGARALAAFIAYSVRATQGAKMWVRAERQGPHHLRIDVDVPARLHTAQELESMLESAGGWAKREHRGLALALQLANSVIKLHGGVVRVIDRQHKGSMFCITLPTAEAVASSRPLSHGGVFRAPFATPARGVWSSGLAAEDEAPDTDRTPPIRGDKPSGGS